MSALSIARIWATTDPLRGLISDAHMSGGADSAVAESFAAVAARRVQSDPPIQFWTVRSVPESRPSLGLSRAG